MTSFEERLARLECGSVKLYAGTGMPQEFRSGGLVHDTNRQHGPSWSAIVTGVFMGAVIGYLFKTLVGIEMFFTKPLWLLIALFKADYALATIVAAMAAAPIFAFGTQLLGESNNRFGQFSLSYLIGAVSINASAWYAFFLNA